MKMAVGAIRESPLPEIGRGLFSEETTRRAGRRKSGYTPSTMITLALAAFTRIFLTSAYSDEFSQALA